MSGHNRLGKDDTCTTGGIKRALSVFVLAALFSPFLFGGSCQNPSDEIFTDQTEITRFMENNLDAQEFFERDLFSADSFLLDSSLNEFRRLLMAGVERTDFRVAVASRRVDIDNFGSIFLASADMADMFSGELTQLIAGLGAPLNRSWLGELNRRALFFKLQGGSAPYLGWEFVGYDLGRPLYTLFADGVTITVNPASGGLPRIISDKDREVLPNGYEDFTLLVSLDALSGNDEVIIRSSRKKYSVFARTSTGFRQLETVSLGANVYSYSYRIPPADPSGRFFHLITFLDGPRLFVDSNFNYFLETLRTDPRIPPDTTIDTTAFFFDTLINTLDTFLTIDTTVTPHDTLWEFLELDPDDTIITFDSVQTDTLIDSLIIVTQVDSTFRDTSHVFDQGELWTFPYSVR